MPASLYLNGSAIAILFKSLPSAIEIPVCIGAGAVLVGLTVALVRFVRLDGKQT
jgi:hypothetical protein